MAGGSFFALLDDIATLLDDVSVMTKIAAKKTAGVVGDDLALNAKQVQGIAAARELPVIWAVTKGSLVNKLILVPVALLLSAFAAFLIKPLLMLGGAYLCFEGSEKILHARGGHHVNETPDPVDEKEKIKGAIRTDFVLSAEIIVIALGTIALGATFTSRLLVLSAIAIGMTVGVYGLVAGIVKLDDAGLALLTRQSSVAKGFGRAILVAAPWLMKFLSVAGTAAMFLVGGEILLHGIPGLHPPEGVVGMLASAATGVGVGLAVVGIVVLGKKLFGKKAAA